MNYKIWNSPSIFKFLNTLANNREEDVIFLQMLMPCIHLCNLLYTACCSCNFAIWMSLGNKQLFKQWNWFEFLCDKVFCIYLHQNCKCMKIYEHMHSIISNIQWSPNATKARLINYFKQKSMKVSIRLQL